MRLLAVLVVALVTGCAAPVARAPLGTVSAAQMNCADLFASAMASRTLVKGVWDCLGPSLQQQFHTISLDGDEGVAQLARKDPVFTQQKFMGRLADGGFVYSLSGPAGASVLIVWLDRDGHVADLQTGGRQHS